MRRIMATGRARWSSICGAAPALRTGGEEIAQGLALMGCRPQWDAATGRVTGVEVLPPAALGRPRVDVTFRISGLFRDMFPAQIALIDAAVGAVAARDEADGDNPLAEALRADGKPPRRVFGSSPGTYGAGIEDLLASGKWEAREEIGRAFIDATSHAFGGADGDGEAAPGAFEERLSSAELLIHTGDDPGRDMLEGSADVAFIGGFAAALAALGRSADVIALDTTDPARPQARSVGEAIARVVRARAVNPRFIEGQMRHGPRGASEFAETVDRLVGFAETTNAVPGALIEAVHDAYLGDAKVRDFILRENPAAARAIAERLAAARRRGPLASAAQFGRRRSRGADRRGARPGDRGMNAPLRRGLCPTLAAPMQTGDGLLVRLNPVASGFSPKTLIGLCEAALSHGNGIVEVTARGNLQIRGLTAQSAVRAVARRRCARHRGARRRAGRDGPLAGLDPEEIADPTPLAERIRKGIAASELETRLGPKVSVVVDGGGRPKWMRSTADVRLTAERRRRRRRLAARRGRQCGNRNDVRWRSDRGRRLRSDAGDPRRRWPRWAGKAGQGIWSLSSWTALGCRLHRSALDVAPLCPAGHLPHKGGDCASERSSPIFRRCAIGESTARASQSPPLWGRCPAGQRGATSSSIVRIRDRSLNDILPLTDARFAVSVALPFGHIRADALIDFIRAAERTRRGRNPPRPTARAAADLPVPHLAEAVQDAAQAAGFIIDAADPRRSIAACPGSPACASGHIPRAPSRPRSRRRCREGLALRPACLRLRQALRQATAMTA